MKEQGNTFEEDLRRAARESRRMRDEQGGDAARSLERKRVPHRTWDLAFSLSLFFVLFCLNIVISRCYIDIDSKGVIVVSFVDRVGWMFVRCLSLETAQTWPSKAPESFMCYFSCAVFKVHL